MPVTQRNLPMLHRKEWQMMAPSPVATAAAMFVVAPGSGTPDRAMLVTSATVQYLYSHEADGFVQIPSAGLAGTFGAGACGAYSPWSITYTATGGTTTTVTVAAASFNITSLVVGETIEFISSGINNGLRRRITALRNDAGAGTITITMDSAVATAVLNTHTFRVSSGRIYLMSAGTTAAGSWKVYDLATMAWQANLVTTNLPASWATDGRAVCTGKVAPVLWNGTATAGSTTSLTDTGKSWEVDSLKGCTVLIISGAGSGQNAKVLSNTATVITLASTLGTALDNTSVYQVLDGKGFFMSGKATSGSATTLVVSTATWTVNQWTNYQLRIIAGTGVGQKSTIASNTGTTLTIGSGATIDNTSVFVIEGDEDKIYLAGNAAVTMYRYSISANTWTVLAPTTARGGAPNTGMCLDWVGETSSTEWASESDIQDGRYLYSMRGGAGGLIDRFDIAGGTSGAGAWTAITYIATETFTTGSSAFQSGRYFYIRKDATNRFFTYDVVGNVMQGWNTDLFPDGAAVLGQKVWVNALDGTGVVKWLYSLANTGTALRRVMIY